MSELAAIAQGVLDRAVGDEQMEVYVARGRDTEIRVYEGDVESLSTATSAGVGVRILEAANGGVRVGFSWVGSLDPDVITDVVTQARDNARFASIDPYAVLARPDGVEPASLTLTDSSSASVPVEEKIEFARSLEAAVRANAKIRQVDSADYGDAVVEAALASTSGIRVESARSSAFASVSAIAGSGDDSQTGSGFTIGRAFGDLDPEDAATAAVERAVRMLGATKASSGKMTVVFDPRVVSTLLGVLSGALSGEAVVKGRSFFDGRLGEQVATSSVTIVDDPTDARAYGASIFDGEGLACRRNLLIDHGVLRGFVYDASSAMRAGATSTGSAVRGGFAGTPGAGCRAIVLEPGNLDPKALLAAVGDGVYVQSITGVHSGVSTVSGDFSVGAEGLMIRNGVLSEPVREFTIASTLQRMLSQITHIGADLTWLPGTAAGQTLAIADMAISGN